MGLAVEYLKKIPASVGLQAANWHKIYKESVIDSERLEANKVNSLGNYCLYPGVLSSLYLFFSSCQLN
jgi:hypothetical protein